MLDSDLLRIGNFCLKGPHHYHAKVPAEHLCTQHHIETDTHTHTLSWMTQMGDIKQSDCGFAYIQKCRSSGRQLVAIGE